MRAAEVARLYGTLDLRDAATDKLARADRSFAAFTGRMDRAGARVSEVGQQLTMTTAPMLAFGATGLRTASDFDAAMTMISARTGLVGDDLQEIADYAQQMGADTVFSSQQAADAFLELLSSGSSTEEAIAQLPDVLDLAAAGALDLGRAADLVTDIMAIYGLEADNASAVTDALARAAASSSADVNQLGDGFTGVGGKAAQMGLDIDETAAILAIFAENGIKGAEAGTQLRSMLTNMTRNTDATVGAWNQLGVSLYDVEGNFRDLDTILNETRTAMDALPMEDQIRLGQDIAGSYGILGFTALLSSDGIGAMTDKMGEATDAGTVAEMQMAGFGQQINSLMGSVQALQVTALTPFMNDTLKPLIVTVKDVVNTINEWAQAHPEATAQIVKVGAALLVLGPTLIATGQLIQLVAAGMSGLALAAGVVAGPVGVLTGVIGGLVFAMHKIYPGGLPQLLIDSSVAATQLSFVGLYHLNSAATAAHQVVTLLGIGIRSMIDWIDQAMQKLPGFVDTVQHANNLAMGAGAAVATGDANRFVAMSPLLTSIFGAPRTGRSGGGPFEAGEPLMVGERGPELLMPTGSGRVVPNESLGGMGGITVNVGNVMVSEGNAQRVADEFADRLTERLRSVR